MSDFTPFNYTYGNPANFVDYTGLYGDGNTDYLVIDYWENKLRYRPVTGFGPFGTGEFEPIYNPYGSSAGSSGSASVSYPNYFPNFSRISSSNFLDGSGAYDPSMGDYGYDLMFGGGGGSSINSGYIGSGSSQISNTYSKSKGNIWIQIFRTVKDWHNDRIERQKREYLKTQKPIIGFPPPIGTKSIMSLFRSPIRFLTGKPLRAFIRFEKGYLNIKGMPGFRGWHLNIGGKGSGLPFHLHIHRYNWFRPWAW